MVLEERQETEEEYLSTRFVIDPERLVARGRSLKILLLHRRCATCWVSLLQEGEKGLEIEVEEHWEKIASHCSRSSDFLQSEQPLMEAVFRVLLGNGKRPMTLQAISQALLERWSDPTSPRTPSPRKLYRMLLADTFYGINQVPEGKGK